MIPSAAFFTVTDRAAVVADRLYASTFSHFPQIEHDKSTIEWSKNGLESFIIKNRFSILGKYFII